MKIGNTQCGDTLSETTDEYLDYVFSMLKTNQILDSDTMDTTSSVYNNYVNDKISLSEFLTHAIKSNWINLDHLEIDDNYYSSDEVFQKITDYVLDEISDDSAFDKKVYHAMVDKGTISGREICLLLYDQGILKKIRQPMQN